MKVINVFITIAIIALLSLLQYVLSVKKPQRIKQFLSIPIAFVLMVLGIILCNGNINHAHELCIKVDYFKNADILFMNLTLLLGFIIVKIILRFLLPVFCKKNEFLEHFSFGFYQHDDEFDVWFLANKWYRFRRYFFILLSACVIVSGVFLGLGWINGPETIYWLEIFPCAAIVVLNEFFAFINGETKEEYKHHVMGDEADARRVNHFYKLRGILETILPEPLLTANSGCDYSRCETPTEFLKQLSNSNNIADQDVVQYFEQKERYKTTDVDCVQATRDLMHHQNVVFFSPFYRDLSIYLTLPITKALLSGKKCVILCGRKSISSDVKLWMDELLKEYSRINELWRVEYLNEHEPDCEVGILTFTQIYDKRVIINNKEFFAKTDFVLLIEPSFILNTGQIALSILAEELFFNNHKAVFCICDRYTDGLIDTMSHLLHTEITNVVAMPVPRCQYTSMSWDADGDFCRQNLFDKQTKYLGNGVELAAIAIKNQIPKVSWYSETKAPVKDIKWKAGQNYATLCRYMNIPVQQNSFYDKINFLSNLWCNTASSEQFVIVEDEFCNMFTMMRAYLTRGTRQTFVNVLSENYLLRDYMRCNRIMFMSNPNAIPSYVPDYAKTARNTLLKLLMMMSIKQVSEEEVKQEFNLAGIESDDVFDTLTKLLREYTYADNSVFTIQNIHSEVDQYLNVETVMYSISQDRFDEFFAETLKNAYFILEEEKQEEGYIDAKLFGHVTQMVLPGQMVIYDGKAYIVKHISPQSGVILRRASDLYDRRRYYRQLRHYHIDKLNNETVIEQKKISDIEFVVLNADFSVTTTGYLELKDNHNLRTANVIDLENDPSVTLFDRKYKNKSILRIQLPEANEKICFTISMLLSEIFKSIYPDGWQYLSVLSLPEKEVEGILNHAIYTVDGVVEKGYIYIVEDSDIDLGLLESFEKNFVRIMEIMADFLDWHFEKIREPASQDPVPKKISAVDYEIKKKRNLLTRMFDRIRKLFGGKEEEVKIATSAENAEKSSDTLPVTEENEANQISEDIQEKDYTLDTESQRDENNNLAQLNVAVAEDDTSPEYTLDFANGNNEVVETEHQNTDSIVENIENEDHENHSEDDFEPEGDEDPDLVAIDGTDIFDNEGLSEDNDYLEMCFEHMGIVPLTKTRYQKECYLKYGYEEIDSRLQIDDVRKYLRVRGWCKNALTLARKREILPHTQIDTEAVNHCDFCSLPLTGVSYEKLTDGRIRCNDCSASAITSVEDLDNLFQQCLEMMESFFDIQYHIPISCQMADARVIAKQIGMLFKPSTEMTSRVLGYAQKKHGKYSLIMENGSPRLAALDTMVHEMTHIWQFFNWPDGAVEQIYGMPNSICTAKAADIVYEGMSMWASVQYLYSIGEVYYATNLENNIEKRQDMYGVGFVLYREQYPFVKDSSILKYSPFKSFPTLEPQDVINAVKSRCMEKECLC